MKKILLIAITALTLSADWLVGANVGYGNMDAEATVSGTTSTADTKYASFRLQGGYEWESVRALAFIGTDAYKDDMLVVDEENADYIGVELDYLMKVSDTTNAFVGLELASGSKDFLIADVDFFDKGIKAGIIHNITDGLDLELAIEYRKRDYDDYNGLDMQDELLGLVIGINFNL